jgi:5-methylcytosine-specific restriction endonuclease McrA
MNDILNKATALILNRNWQAINVRTPANAFCQMAINAATGLDIEGHDIMRPVTWVEWLALPVRPQDRAVGTPRGLVRVPTVIVCVGYAKVPLKRPALSARNIRERDRNRCQYTGKILRPNEGSIDHVVPRSRGGRTTWENCVLANREINTRKANRLPQEAGLRLISRPRVPHELPVTMTIRNVHAIRDWEPFLYRR